MYDTLFLSLKCRLFQQKQLKDLKASGQSRKQAVCFNLLFFFLCFVFLCLIACVASVPDRKPPPFFARSAIWNACFAGYMFNVESALSGKRSCSMLVLRDSLPVECSSRKKKNHSSTRMEPMTFTLPIECSST